MHKAPTFQEHTCIKINIGMVAGESGWALANLLCLGASGYLLCGLGWPGHCRVWAAWHGGVGSSVKNCSWSLHGRSQFCWRHFGDYFIKESCKTFRMLFLGTWKDFCSKVGPHPGQTEFPDLWGASTDEKLTSQPPFRYSTIKYCFSKMYASECSFC